MGGLKYRRSVSLLNKFFDTWICEVVPIANTFALALADRLSLDLP